MLNLTNNDLKIIANFGDWHIKKQLPDGRYVGNGRKVKKINKEINLFASNFAISKFHTLLELGCAEGYNTVELSQLCKKLTVSDCKIKNLVLTTILTLVYEQTNIIYDYRDLNKTKELFGNYDYIYHTGVLYHLLDPIFHLAIIANMTDNLFLSTRCYKPNHNIPNFVGLIPSQSPYRQYQVNEKFNYKERAFSGLESYSMYIHHEDIPKILNDVGFTNIKLIYETNDDRPKVIYTAQKNN